MDVQFWIYIIIGVIYFLSRLLKKPEQAPEEQTDTRPPERRRPVHSEQTTGERPKQLTFEELLREITEGKQAQKPAPQPKPQPRYESFDNDLGEEAKSLEDVGYDEAENARVFKAYEDAKSQVFQRTSLEETLRLQDTNVDFGKFKEFEAQKKRNVLNDYIKIIRNPVSLKHAVVMSEILKRKF
ncbi:MAG: hypothetical protein WD824_16985 [Cyclobacteriaceae bacterium]